MELPNGCRASEPAITPNTYGDRKKFMPSKPWAIQYRFTDIQGKEHPVQVRGGLNRIKTWKERKEVAEVVLKNELNKLMNGYNPRTKETKREDNDGLDIMPDNTFLEAMEYALIKAKNRIGDSAWEDAQIVVNFMKDNVKLSDIKIGGIGRKQVLKVLERVEKVKIDMMGEFSNNNYNHFRKYIGILFRDLIQAQVVEFSPVDEYLMKRPVVKKFRKTLSDEERKVIKEKVANAYPYFFRYIQIFFHSGARNTEMCRLKGNQVFLKEQYYIATILKGGQYLEVPKAIKTIALPYWEDVMEDCDPNDYVFSKGLKPGVNKIDAAQITRRWKEHIKVKLEIDADLYSLKHLNTQEVSEVLGIEAAAKHNSHTSTKMTETHYDHEGEQQRKIRFVRDMRNVF